MKSKAILCTLISLSMSSGAIFAQDRDRPGNDDNRGHQEQARGREPDQPRNRHPDRPQRFHREQGRQEQGWQERGRQRERPPGDFQREMDRGAGPQHAFHRGGRLPSYYHQQRYVVDDWRGRNLSAPPRGYHWVQTGDDFVLVAIATGVILQLLLNH